MILMVKPPHFVPLHPILKLDLGANRIRLIDGLEGCEALEELWLGRNKIKRISGVCVSNIYIYIYIAELCLHAPPLARFVLS